MPPARSSRRATASTSPTRGAPGTFTNMDIAANSTPDPRPADPGAASAGSRSGSQAARTQNHQIVYALVQDAVKFNGGALGLDANEPGAAGPAYSDYLNARLGLDGLRRELEGARGLDDDRQRHDERLGARAAHLQGPRGDLLLPRDSGLVQPLGLAGSDAGHRGRRPDPARVRARGGLGKRPVARRRRPASTARPRRASPSSAATTRVPPARC